MKFQINIYKPGKRPKVKIPREPSPTRLPIFVFVGAIMLVLLGFAYLYSGQIGTLKRKMRGDQKQTMILREFLEELKEGRSQKSGVKALLVHLQAGRVLWGEKLVELSRLVPDEVRLTYLGMEVVEKRPDPRRPRKKVKETVLTLKGEILAKRGEESLDHIAHLIMNLNESPVFNGDFEPMALVYTQRVKTRDREIMEFELSGRLQRKSKEG